MMEEGLFRRSPNTVMLNQAKQAYDRGHPVSLESFGDAHLAAVLLKKFLKDLPEPIVPEDCYPIIRRCPPASDDPSDVAAVHFIREQILPSLHSHAAVVLLSYILRESVTCSPTRRSRYAILDLLHDVSLRSAHNKMDAHNLALVLSPNLVAGSNPARDVQMCMMANSANLPPFPGIQRPSFDGTTLSGVMKICIERYFEIFDEVRDRAEATAPSRINSMDPPTPPFVLSDDTDSDSASVLVMPTSPTRASVPSPTSPTTRMGPASTPPSAFGKARYRVMSTPPSAMPTSSAFTSNASSSSLSQLGEGSAATRSLHASASSDAVGTMSGTMRHKTRSMLSIEKNINASGGRGSITLGKGIGTLRKSAGSAVEAVSVTASGFFTPPGGESAVAPLVDPATVSSSAPANDATTPTGPPSTSPTPLIGAGESAREREGKSRELSEVSE